MQLHTVIECLVVGKVALIELVKGIVLSMPDVVSYLTQLGCFLCNGMLVKAIETRFIHDIDHRLMGMGDGE